MEGTAGVHCYCGAWQYVYDSDQFQYCLVCHRELETYREIMAKKKNISVKVNPKTDPDVFKAGVLKEDEEFAKIALDAAIAADWGQVRQGVDSMEAEFDTVMSGPEGVKVKVLKVGKDGELTDVSDRVNPRDLTSNDIEEFEFQGVKVPTLPDGHVDRAAAMELLRKIVTRGDSMFPTGTSFGRSNQNKRRIAVSEAIRRMEATLEESDNILKHWK